MNMWNVVIAAFDAHASVAEATCRSLRDAWGASNAQFHLLRVEDLTGESLKKHDALVFIADRTFTQSTTLSVLDAVEEAGVPMLTLLDEIESDNFFEYAGALVETWKVADHRLAALLQGLLHRQDEVKRLTKEATLNQRFHGGLKGQINKMHEELQLAAMVQREFLPRDVPSMHGVDFGALWRPTNYVSGDIYDLTRLDEDHVGVFIADAVGHGVPAALMTMVICRSLTTKEITGNTYRIIPASEVLARLNMEMIRRQGRTTRFATAVYAIVDCRRRVVQLAGAGHPAPLRLGADGHSQALETRGGLLGVFPDEEYDQIEFELALGDRLLLYTDGFEQAFPSKAGDAHERRVPTMQYRDEFDQLAKLPTAADMVDVISRRLDDQAGSLHQVDDLTLICVHAGNIASEREPDAETSVANVRQPRRVEGLRLAS